MSAKLETRIKAFIQRLFVLRNITPIIVIIAAIIGSLGATPFGIKLSSDQLVILLLAFLAVDALVERLDILTGIEDGIQSIGRLLKAKGNATSFFKIRNQLSPIDDLIAESHKEIWISGPTLNTVFALKHLLRDKLKQGCNIRILFPDPDSDRIRVTAEYFDSGSDWIANMIKTNLKGLATSLGSTSGVGKVEIRLIDMVFPTGYIIIDPGSPNGRMRVQFYLYHVSSSKRPLFELSKKDDEFWFFTYLNQYEAAWSKSKEYEYKPQANIANSHL